MSRRAAVATTLAFALLSSGAVPLLGSAHASGCVTWTDPQGDHAPLGNPNLKAVPGAANHDIVGAAVKTVGDRVVGMITVADLDEGGYTLTGDEFVIQLDVAGSAVGMIATRTESGIAGKGALRTPPNTTGVAEAWIDPTTNSVFIAATPAELAKAAGKAVDGVEVGVTSAEVSTTANATTIAGSDTANPPSGTTFRVGTQCSPVEVPITVRWPDADCKTFDDGGTDAKPSVGGAPAPDEPDLDVKEVTFNSTADHFFTYVKVSTLGSKPANFPGDRFEVSFTSGAKTYSFSGGRVATGKKVTPYPTRGQVGGTTDTKLRTDAYFDTAKNTVVIVVDRKTLNEVNGSAIADGATVTGVSVKTYALLGPQAFLADTAEHTDTAQRTYTFGDNPCFAPPKSKLASVLARTVQFGDTVTVGAKLTTEDGTPIAGKDVKLTLGATTTTVETGSDGLAVATLTPPLVAGSYSLVAAFTGDATAQASTLTTPFTVTQEKTKLTLTVAKSGSRRTVTAKLLDDDGKPVVGQVVTWYVNNKKVSAPRTNGSGVVTLTTAKPTQTVKAVFAAVSGKYLGSTAQAKV